MFLNSKFYLFLTLGLAFSLPSNEQLTSNIIDDESRIVRGLNATQGQFPFLIAMQYIASMRNATHAYKLRTNFCSGAIIDKRWILTAAHCILGLQKKNSPVFIVAGVTDPLVDITPERQDIQVAKMIAYPKYVDGEYMRYDIGLLCLEKDIQFSSRVRPIKLPAKGEPLQGDPYAYIMGWGATNPKDMGNSQANLLQYTRIVVETKDECNRKSYFQKRPITSAHYCAGGYGGVGICKGDSGSPLVHNDKVHGVASYTVMPCATDSGVYTKVSDYIDFITETMKQGC